MRKFFLAVAVLLITGAAFTALAADVVVPQSHFSGKQANVLVGAAEKHKNLYTAGANVTVNGDTQGDLVVAGGTLNLTGKVEQELIATGGTINVSGSVGGHARIAGGNITVQSPVGGDLVVAGGNVELTESGSVSGDLLIAGGQVSVSAPVKGSVRAAAGQLYINSKVEGNVYAKASQDVSFGPKAEVVGTVYYKAPKEAALEGGAKVAHMEYTHWQGAGRGAWAGLITLAFLAKVLAWIVVGLVIFGFHRRATHDFYMQAQSKPWENIVVGLVVLIVVPILTVLLLLVLVGYYLAVIVAVAYVLMLLLSVLFGAFTFGHYLFKLFSKGTEYPDWYAIVLGVVAWNIVRFIPFLGWVVMALLFLLALGTLSKLVRKSLLTAK